MSAIQATAHSFIESVQQNNQPVLVDFWAPWCGPCRAMSSVVDELAEDVAGKATVVKANVDEFPKEASEYGVQSIPAFFVVKDGEIQQRISGVVSKQKLREALEPYMNA